MIIKRLFLYLTLPTGITLLFLPVYTHRHEDIAKELLSLEILQTLKSSKVESKTESALDADSTTDDALQLHNSRTEEFSERNSDDVPVENSSGYPILSDRDLAPYPALKKQVDGLRQIARLTERDQYSASRLEKVPLSEWTSLKENCLLHTAPGIFQYGDAIFRGETQVAYVSTPVQVKNLEMGRRLTGGVLLFLGLLVVPSLYRGGTGENGIQIGNQGAIVVWDVIVVAVGVVFHWWFVDIAVTKLFGTESFWGDDPIKAMGIFWVAAVDPFMALFVSGTAAQTLNVNKERIVLSGIFGKKTLAWPEVNEIHVLDLRAPRPTGETVGSKSATRSLQICGSRTTLRVMEPPLTSTKHEVLRKLAAFAPEHLQLSIEQCAKQWTSAW